MFGTARCIAAITQHTQAYFAALANEKCETAVSLFAQRRLAAQANAAQFPALAARAQASDEILACAAEQLEIYNSVHDARCFAAWNQPVS